MKKTVKQLVVIIAMCALALSIMPGCASNTEDYREKSYVVAAAEADQITIDVKDRKIDMGRSDDGQIHITYFETEKEFYQLGVTNGELVMTAAQNKTWSDYIGTKAVEEYRTIRVLIPDAPIRRLTLKTTNVDLSLPPLAVTGEATLAVSGGTIQLDKLDVGTGVHLEAKNGDVRGTIIGSYEDFAITSRVKKGESNLPAEKQGGAKVLDVSVNHGDIALEITQ